MMSLAASLHVAEEKGEFGVPHGFVASPPGLSFAIITEPVFLEKAMPLKPLTKDGVKEKLQCPVRPKSDDPDDVKATFAAKQRQYQDAINTEFVKFSNDDNSSDVYLCFQPIWNAQTKSLTGLEVLARVMDGGDNAPMPGMKVWQENDRDNSTKFLKKQFTFAAEACQKLPAGITVGVNCRPDELAEVKDHIKECASLTGEGCATLLTEITEYSPITPDVLALISEMKVDGCLFALDDVTEVNDSPGKGMAKTGQHACSFALAKERKDLFVVQKLAMPLSCSVFRTEVFPTPKFDGGNAQSFLKSLIFPVTLRSEIDLRKQLVENWVQEIREQRQHVRIIIECSVSQEELADVPRELLPKFDPFDGTFEVQGGCTGGRGYSLEAFLP